MALNTPPILPFLLHHTFYFQLKQEPTHSFLGQGTSVISQAERKRSHLSPHWLNVFLFDFFSPLSPSLCLLFVLYPELETSKKATHTRTPSTRSIIFFVLLGGRKKKRLIHNNNTNYNRDLTWHHLNVL